MDTTGDPEGGETAPAGPGPVQPQPADEEYGGQPGGYGYTGGYGYAPGYGDPDGGDGYGAGYGDPGYGDPGVSYQPPQPPQPPASPLPPPVVVAATPALKGYPGGPGLEIPENGVASRDSHDLTTPSAWQLAQRAWRDAGVEWQQSAAGWEPAEAEWDRVHSRPAGKSPGSSPFRVRRGVWLAAVAVIVVLALVVGGFLVFGGSGGKAAVSAAAQYPPARLAGPDFSTDPGQQGRGIFQSVSGLAASAGTIVAIGRQTGQWLPRAQFTVSVDGGRSWRLAPVRAAGEGAPSPSLVPRLIAGGPALPGGQGGWLALGSGATWTSQDGKTWLLAAGSGIGPLAGGDRVAALARTGSGFIAVGQNVPSAGAASSPVIWTSPNGLSWQRLAGSSLRLAAAGGRVLRVTAVAANGSDVIVQGVIAMAAGGKGRHKTPGRLAPGVWQSGDDGASWAPARIPAGRGASAAIDGIAATSSGFVVIRPGDSKSTGPDAVAYTSRTGASWSRAAAITATRKDNLRVTGVGGSDQGVAVAGQITGGAKVAYVSSDGRSWRGVANLGGTAQALAGVTVTTGGTVVAGGATGSSPAGQQPYLVLAGAHASTVSFGQIKGATGPALAVNAMAVAGGQQLAVGSANGFPAIWSSARGGRWTRLSSAALARPGLAALADVVHGRAGWLAVGGIFAAAPGRPIVVTSPDGASWQAADAESAFAGPGISLYQAAAGPAGYVIVGRQVIPARTVRKTTVLHRRKKVTSYLVAGRTIAAAWWSAGLTGWNRAANAGPVDLNGPGARQMLAVTAAGTGFVAVGSARNAPAAWTSSDGKLWQLTGLRQPDGGSAAALNRVTAIGNLIVATGTETTPAGSVPFAEASSDGGIIWRQVPLSAPGGATAVTGLTAAGRGFIAVGTAGPPGDQRVVVWSSRDGTRWQPHEPAGTGLSGQGSQAITALTASGSALIGTGFTATPAAEQPTLWRANAG